MKTTKHTLFLALAMGQALDGTQIHTVCSLEREDGSGHNWNVTGHDVDGKKVTMFIQTIDQ